MKHTDTPPAPASAAVAGLARQVEQMARDVAAMKQGLRQTASAGELTRLAQVVTELGQTLAAAPGRAPVEPDTVPSWLALPYEPAEAEAVLGDVLGWMRDIYLQYADARDGLPQCWLWHPEVVEELLWLMYAWLGAYQGDSASIKAAGDWHDRLRPGVVKRIDTYTRGCNFTRHKTTGPVTTIEVPTSDVADSIVLWWTTARDHHGPTPTAAQIDAARAALSRDETGDL